MAERKTIPSRGAWLRRAGPQAVADRKALARRLAPHELAALGNWYWEGWARDAQLPPTQAWRIWLIRAGRGFGKTRAGAEWVRDVARHDGAARIALVGANLGEVRAVMVEGESGVLAAAPGALAPDFEPSLRRLTWENGAQAFLYSAAEPDSLRGGQFSHAWCDEIAKWDNASGRAVAAWDNLQLGMRLGESPRIVATTTPRRVPLMKRLADAAMRGEVAIATGKTTDNDAVLPADFFAAMIAEYDASNFGRQELDGELIEDVEGALWSRALLERCRVAGPVPDARRVVVGVDPPASATGDACGIVVAELGVDGIATVRADCSVEKASPDRWANAVAQAAAVWGADRVVAEKNMGGEMVKSVLLGADIALPVKLVHASRAKAARAEPLLPLYQNGKVRHAGLFAALEDELCGMMAGGGYEGPGRSPDRADALVWALTELMLGPKGEPRVWVV
jgi:phage terminase large subunit-like protein